MEKKIYGNNFLVTIAYTSETPTQAAKIAKLHGYDRATIRAVRNAAKLKRDKGEETFNKIYSPWEKISIVEQDCTDMIISLQFSYDKSPINTVEYNEIADYISYRLKGLGIETIIKRKDICPCTKSRLNK